MVLQNPFAAAAVIDSDAVELSYEPTFKRFSFGWLGAAVIDIEVEAPDIGFELFGRVGGLLAGEDVDVLVSHRVPSLLPPDRRFRDRNLVGERWILLIYSRHPNELFDRGSWEPNIPEMVTKAHGSLSLRAGFCHVPGTNCLDVPIFNWELRRKLVAPLVAAAKSGDAQAAHDVTHVWARSILKDTVHTEDPVLHAAPTLCPHAPFEEVVDSLAVVLDRPDVYHNRSYPRLAPYERWLRHGAQRHADDIRWALTLRLMAADSSSYLGRVDELRSAVDTIAR